MSKELFLALIKFPFTICRDTLLLIPRWKKLKENLYAIRHNESEYVTNIKKKLTHGDSIMQWYENNYSKFTDDQKRNEYLYLYAYYKAYVSPKSSNFSLDPSKSGPELLHEFLKLNDIDIENSSDAYERILKRNDGEPASPQYNLQNLIIALTCHNDDDGTIYPYNYDVTLMRSVRKE